MCALGHGIWLHSGELERALAYVKYLETEGADKRARDAEIERRVAHEKSRIEAERAARNSRPASSPLRASGFFFDD